MLKATVLNLDNARVAKELAVLSDGAPWTRTVCKQLFAERNAAFILDLFRALKYAAAVQAAQVITTLKPHRDRSEAVAVCIRTCEENADRMRCDLCRKRGLPVGAGVAKAPASTSSGTGSNRRGAAGRKRALTPCSPSDTASKTCVGPASSMEVLSRRSRMAKKMERTRIRIQPWFVLAYVVIIAVIITDWMKLRAAPITFQDDILPKSTDLSCQRLHLCK